MAEFEAFYSQFEPRPDQPAYIWRIKTRLHSVVELDFHWLDGSGVLQADYAGRDYSATQRISEAVNYLGCDGLIVPSARYSGDNLIVYLQNLADDCFIVAEAPSVFTWSPATTDATDNDKR